MVLKEIFLNYSPVPFSLQIPRNSNINEKELDAIQVGFQKSGHLTCIKMNFRYCNLYQNPKILPVLSHNLEKLEKLKCLYLNLEGTKLGKNPFLFHLLSNTFKNVKGSLTQLNLNLNFNQIGNSQLNLKYLCNGISQLRNLRRFELKIGKNDIQDIAVLAIGLDKLRSLKQLQLDLSGNNLGQQDNNIVWLTALIKSQSQLESLDLDLSENSFRNMSILFANFKDLFMLQNLCLSLYGNWNSKDLKNSVNNWKFLAQGLKSLQELKKLDLNLKKYNFGENLNNLRLLSEGIQGLKGIEEFKLDLSYCNLGNIVMNATVLGEGIQNLKQIRCLDLNLQGCYTEENMNSLQFLFIGLTELKNINHFCLNLSYNCMGKQEENMRILTNAISNYQGLQSLSLNFSNNFLGQNCENIRLLAQCFLNLSFYFQKLPLEYLNLDLGQNRLWEGKKNLLYLSSGLQMLRQLKELRLELKDNGMGKNEEDDMKHLYEGLKELDRLKGLGLGLAGNGVGRNVEGIRFVVKLVKELALKRQKLDRIYLDLERNLLDKFQLNFIFLFEGLSWIGKNNNNNDNENEKNGGMDRVCLRLRKNGIGQQVENVRLLREWMRSCKGVKQLEVWIGDSVFSQELDRDTQEISLD